MARVHNVKKLQEMRRFAASWFVPPLGFVRDKPQSKTRRAISEGGPQKDHRLKPTLQNAQL